MTDDVETIQETDTSGLVRTNDGLQRRVARLEQERDEFKALKVELARLFGPVQPHHGMSWSASMLAQIGAERTRLEQERRLGVGGTLQRLERAASEARTAENRALAERSHELAKRIDLQAEVARLEQERDELRATNSRLNRRCQQAESGLAEKIKKVEASGWGLGRMLANAGYSAVKAERDALQALVDELQSECRYEVEPGHFVRCPEGHGSNGSLYDERDALQARVEELTAALERIRGEDYPAQVADLNEMLKDTEQERDGLREALSWALDLLDLYDEHLIELGDPREKVYSPVHVAGKAKARTALSQSNTSTTEGS